MCDLLEPPIKMELVMFKNCVDVSDSDKKRIIAPESYSDI